MKQWLALFVASLVLGVLAVILTQTGFALIGFILGILAVALFIWWLLRLTLVTRSLSQESPPSGTPRPTFRRSVTAALHAAIFSSPVEEEE